MQAEAQEAEAQEAERVRRVRPGRDKHIDEDGPVASLQEIRRLDLPEAAADQSTSRLLQRSLLKGGPEVAGLVCEKVEACVLELARDQHGSSLAQRVLDVCELEQFRRLFTQMAGEMQELMEDVHGTRVVQKVVEQATPRDMLSELLAAIPGELIAAMAWNASGFHVVVKLLECLPPEELDRLLDLLVGTPQKALTLGCDQWGCCVLKKCLGRSEGAARQRVVESIVGSVLELVQDAYGNYVVQHLFITGGSQGNPYVAVVVDALRGHIFELCLQKFSSNVLEKCLRICADKERDVIINELLTPPEYPPTQAVHMLLFHQFGNYVFQQALEMAREPQYSLLVEHSRQHIQESAKRERDGEEETVATSDGTLSAEYARRLSQKLLRRHRALCEGAPELMEELAWSQGFDPYTAGFCPDAYSGWGCDPAQGAAFYGLPFPGFDVAALAAAAGGVYPSLSSPSRAKGKRSGSARKAGKRAQAGGGQQPGQPAGGDVLRVGRIVGYWPNYSVAYDNAPPVQEALAATRATSGRGARSKKKAHSVEKKPPRSEA